MTRAFLTAEHAHILIEALALLEVTISDEHVDHECDYVEGCSDCTLRQNRIDATQNAETVVRRLADASGVDFSVMPSSIDPANYAY